MIFKFNNLAMLAILVVPSISYSHSQCLEIYSKLRTCQHYQCSELDPIFPPYHIKHHIIGRDGQNNCLYQQKFGVNATMNCKFSQDIIDKIYQQVKIYNAEYRKHISTINYFSERYTLKDYDPEKKVAEQASVISSSCKIRGKYFQTEGDR